MSPHRFIREMIILAFTATGALIGFIATVQMEPVVNSTCSFLGMAVFGAFADFCLRGGK